jgi:hypothetical protein
MFDTAMYARTDGGQRWVEIVVVAGGVQRAGRRPGGRREIIMLWCVHDLVQRGPSEGECGARHGAAGRASN